MAVKHSLIVEYKNIKKFKNKEEYLVQKIKPQSFVINRDLKDRFAVIKIYYDEAKFYGRDTKTTKFKKITGADLEVYKEARKYLSATEDAMLMDAWDNAR